MLHSSRGMIERTRVPAAIAGVLLVACVLHPAPALAQLQASVITTGFTSPVEFVQDPLDPRTQYVLEQSGTIYIIRNGVRLATPFLDFTGQVLYSSEQGILGLAFAPDFATSLRFFVYFNSKDDGGNIHVARFKRGSNGLADVSTRFDFTWSTRLAYIDHSLAGNHNGGHIQFGPDGYLYIGIGDGGFADDPFNNSQNMSVLLGKMLRIDVNVPDSNPNGFQIPADNPFVGVAGARPELWDVGLRNPWKFSFDDPTRGGSGALIIADVGQGQWEEVDYEPAGSGGKNYGWSIREGAHDYITSKMPAFLPLTDPVIEYPHPVGFCIIGGYVYRGHALPPFYRGRYFFADYVNARLWSVATDPATGALLPSTQIEHTDEVGGRGVVGNVTSFGVDSAGELYLLSQGTGRVIKLTSTYVPTSPGSLGLNSDGTGDAFVYNATTGAWVEELSEQGGGFVTQSGAWRSGWTITPVDFNQDGLTDFFLYDPVGGTWYKAINDGLGGFQYTSGQWRAGWNVTIADLNGDGFPDVFLYNPSTGDWYQCLTMPSNPTGDFTYAASGTWTAGWQVLPGRFAPHPRMMQTDLFLYRPSDGMWYRVTGADAVDSMSPVAFSYATGPQWSSALTLTAADLNADGLTDIFVYRASDGAWAECVSTVDSRVFMFTGGMWPAGYTIRAGDFDHDGYADIFAYNATSGAYAQYRNDMAGGFVAVTSGTWITGWQIAVSDLDGNGRADLILYNAANGMWYQVRIDSSGMYNYTSGTLPTGLTLYANTTRVP
jgi:glucose/arabinose dehydrogenase